MNEEKKTKKIKQKKKKPYVPVWEKANLTIEEAAAYSNIGINTLADRVRDPLCPYALYVGKRKSVIKRKEFEKYMSTHQSI